MTNDNLCVLGDDTVAEGSGLPVPVWARLAMPPLERQEKPPKMKLALVLAATVALLVGPAGADEQDGKATFTLLLLTCTKGWVCATNPYVGPTRGLTAKQCADVLSEREEPAVLENSARAFALCIGEQDATTRWLVDQLARHEIW